MQTGGQTPAEAVGFQGTWQLPWTPTPPSHPHLQTSTHQWPGFSSHHPLFIFQLLHGCNKSVDFLRLHCMVVLCALKFETLTHSHTLTHTYALGPRHCAMRWPPRDEKDSTPASKSHPSYTENCTRQSITMPFSFKGRVGTFSGEKTG